jgi:hypothetical protein
VTFTPRGCEIPRRWSSATSSSSPTASREAVDLLEVLACRSHEAGDEAFRSSQRPDRAANRFAT